MSNYSAFIISSDEKRRLLELFPETYPDVIADHITFALSNDYADRLFHPKQIEITGMAHDNNGLQVLLARVDGQTHRPDGTQYHITWSMDRSKTVPDAFLTEFQRESGAEITYKPRHSKTLLDLLDQPDQPDHPYRYSDIAPIVQIYATPAHIEHSDGANRKIHFLHHDPAGLNLES